MAINLASFLCLLLLLLVVALVDLSPIDNDQPQARQAQVANTIVNQPAPPLASSSQAELLASTTMQWITTLKNITEDGGKTVVLECQVQSSYPVSFNWYRYNNPLDKSRFLTDQSAFRSSIRLSKLKETEAGFYTCEVSNGFQTIASTGFVRVTNPVDVGGQLDVLDDSLPPIEFQPEIVANNELSANKLACEVYSGQMCRSVIGSRLISLSHSSQKDVEQNLVDNLKSLTANKFLSTECRQLLLPMVCAFTYPTCDNDRLNTRSICRRSCDYFQNNACANLFAYQPQQSYAHVQILQSIPTCESLPPASDDPSCINFDQAILKRPNGSSAGHTRANIRRPSSSASLLIVLLSILVPVAVICLLMLFLCWCCHQRNNKSHLSSCSSTSTPIKKTSHMINTVTSSPFRVSMTPNHVKQNHRHILPSSSSSTNTNFTNTYLRQSLLKADAKRPAVQLPAPGSSLAEIPFTNIRVLQELGEGEYGRIYRGELVDSSTKCLIKTLQTDLATPQNRDEYTREIEIFRHIRHTNISCLLGICIQPQDALSLMIYERLNDGDLHEYLLQRSSINASCQQRDLTDFLYISIQILSGMIYLSEKNFVHNDLSAKNILISEHMDIKISNIARYRPKYDADYYKIANRSLPVRWMAIESLMSGIYTEMSDVWSFGVLLWEMFSYGAQPYHGRTNPEVIEMIRDRKLLTCPPHCPKRIYAVMCSCWEELSEQRPTFVELMGRLRQFEEKTTTLSSTASSSLADVPPAVSHGEVLSPKYRTFISPPPPPPVASFARNETLTNSGRMLTPSSLGERDHGRFEM